MTCKGGGGVVVKTLAAYEAKDLGAPFRVILEKSVTVEYDQHGKITKTVIPDLGGLIHAVVVARVMHSRKLSGDELRFVRKSMGWKGKDLASKLEVSAEHWSRCEAGKQVLSNGTEKLLRVYCIFKTPDKTAIADLGLGDNLFEAIKIDGVWSPSDKLSFRFSRSKVITSPEQVDDGKWRPDKAA